MTPKPAVPVLEPRLAAAHFVASDGAILPLRRWIPEDARPKAVIIALHGFNDYSRAFELPGQYFRRNGVACYAYDQRGFGLSPMRGNWVGAATLIQDLRDFAGLIRQRHPDVPVFVLGESMGAAVVIVAASASEPLAADGVILSAPAVWARSTMPWYQLAALEVSARTVPWLRVTGEGLGVVASDNIEILRGLGRDPSVIKETRVDAIYGLVDLMDAAMSDIDHLRMPALVLIGARDEIIPKEPLETMLMRLPRQPQSRVASYANGYHLLLRDLQAEKPWRDIVTWVQDETRPLPSGSERDFAMRAAPKPDLL